MDSIENSKRANGLQVRRATIEECAMVNDNAASAIENVSVALSAETRRRGKEVAEILRTAAASIRALPVIET